MPKRAGESFLRPRFVSCVFCVISAVVCSGAVVQPTPAVCSTVAGQYAAPASSGNPAYNVTVVQHGCSVFGCKPLGCQTKLVLTSAGVSWSPAVASVDGVGILANFAGTELQVGCLFFSSLSSSTDYNTLHTYLFSSSSLLRLLLLPCRFFLCTHARM